MMDGPLVARRDAMVRFGGTVHQVWGGHTTAHPDSPVVRDYPDLWGPVRIDFPAEAASVAGQPKKDTPALSSKAVRAWAREQGIEVPARGPLPEDVVARYQAAAEG